MLVPGGMQVCACAGPKLSLACACTRLTLRRGFWKALVFANYCFCWIFSFYCHGNCN